MSLCVFVIVFVGVFVIEFVIVFVGLMLTRGCKSVSYKRRGRGQSSCVPTSSAFLNVVHCTLLPSSFLKLRQCVRLRLPVTSPHLSLSWQKLTGWSGKARRLFVFSKWTPFHLLVVASSCSNPRFMWPILKVLAVTQIFLQINSYFNALAISVTLANDYTEDAQIFT